MLAPLSADLVRRDAAIPGLATILDPEIFIARLQPFFPEIPIIAARPHYIRYKPGMNCLAAYQIEAGGLLVNVYAKAHHSNAEVKLEKAANSNIVPGPLSPGRLILDNCAVVVSFFPNDSKLKRLRGLGGIELKKHLFQKFVPDAPDPLTVKMETLGYKPERRYVARLSTATGPAAVLKFYSPPAFRPARKNARAFASQGSLQIARYLGKSDRHKVLGFQWLPGRLLTEIIAEGENASEALLETGAALAEFHIQEPRRLPVRKRKAEAAALFECAEWLGFVFPLLAEQAKKSARRLAAWLMAEPSVQRAIHGDFYARQVLRPGGRIGIIDLDEAVKGDPRADLGSFIARLEWDALRGKLPTGSLKELQEIFFEGYRRAGEQFPEASIRPYVAAELFKLIHTPFRTCESEWARLTEALLERVDTLVSESIPVKPKFSVTRTLPGTKRVSFPHVEDPFDVIRDDRMPFLASALDFRKAEARLARMLRANNGRKKLIQLEGIRVLRHKAGLRCLVEYILTVKSSNGQCKKMILLGKARARGLDSKTYRLCEALWNSGFDSNSQDGISVPQPVGMIPEFQMWFQRKVSGTPATQLLLEKNGTALAKRIASAIHKVHQANITPHRQHSMKRELDILRDRLSSLASIKPRWRPRLEWILDQCERLGAAVPASESTGIHRDFYPDHVLVNKNRLYLLDFDLFCTGDRSLDIGNFQGHLTEQSLRTLGNADALGDREEALEEAFLDLAGGQFRRSIRAYKTLTLVRHIYISTRFPERQPYTEHLLELCEQHLGKAEQAFPGNGSGA